MYKITFLHKDETEERDLYLPGDDDYCLLSATLDVACGTSGELVVQIPDINPAKAEIDCLTDEIVVYRFQENESTEIWRGRPVTLQVDFDLTGTLTCEGILSYLYDTYYEPFEFEGPPKELLQDIIDSHNSKVEKRKQFTLGEITVEDPNDYINRSSIYYNRTLTVLQEKFIEDSLGGYFRVRVDGDTRYLDYLVAYNTESTQPVEYGYNLLDIAQNIEYSDVASVILPLGARLEDEDGNETDERLTIASVNGGDIYLQDQQAVATYGWIVVEVEWDDVTLPENLYNKAYEYLAQVTSPISRFTIQAVDLSLADPTIDPINLGDYVLIRVDSHGVNQYVELTGMDIDLLDPANSILEFGTDAATLTGSSNSTQRTVQESLGNLSLRVTNLTANVINAVYANIEEIVASTITADFIRAAVADLGYVTADYVEANYASIYALDAIYADILALQAVSADVELLNADVANIISLLAGNAGVGDLQSIVLTTDNAYIEDAVILNALVGTILADIINSNIIYTDQITIMSENGGIVIAGTTMQITDENGTVRMQLGQDADGGFTFVIYDETGTGIMIDSEGIHESAVPDGLIVDQMVAEDANISASKLNIEELTETLNANGQLILSAEQITIGGGTLDYTLTEIQQQIDSLEAVGIESIENWYAVSSSPDFYPPLEEDPDESAVLGEGILGLMILGETGDFQWTTDQPPYEEGKYIWWAQKYTYYDGTIIWTEPALWTDDYLRNEIVITQTELNVVQGEIQAKVWMSDITELADEVTSISDQYGILTVSVDEIDQRVGSLTTTVDTYYTELYSQITAITLDMEGITAEVREVSQKTENAITDGVAYYAISYSPSYYPPFEWDDDDSAVLGEAILGYMVLGVNGDSNWTTNQPEAKEGEYVWVSYYRTRVDGSTYWTEPILLTDTWGRESYSEISMKVDSLSLTVSDKANGTAYIGLTVGDNTDEVQVVIEAREAFEASSSSITIGTGVITFAAGTIVIDSSNFTLDAVGNATFSGRLLAPSGTIGGFTIGATSIYTNSDSFGASGNIYIGSSGISLGSTFTVTNSGVLTATSGTVGGWTITGSKIYNKDGESNGTAVIQMPSSSVTNVFAAGGSDHSNYSDCPFRVTKAGALYATNANITGSITATGGSIGAFTISSSSMYTNSNSFGASGNIYIGSSGISLGSTFQVTSGGSLTATSGTIGGWYLTSSRIRSSSSVSIGGSTAGLMLINEDDKPYINTQDGNGNTTFQVSRDGSVTLVGSITATSGKIGNWTITSSSIQTAAYKSSSGMYFGSSGISITDSFYVSSSGSLSATKGSIGGWTITEHRIYGGDIDNGGVSAVMKCPDDDTGGKWVFACGGSSQSNYGDCPFRVDTSGNLYAALVRAENSNGATSLYVNSSYHGLYDTTNSVWLVRSSSSSGTVYLGNSDHVTRLYGSSIYLNDTTTAVTSDRKIKSDIEPLSANYDDLLDLITPRAYRVNSNPDEIHLGFVVDEVEAAMRKEGFDPDDYGLTEYFEDEETGEYTGAIRYDEFIPILVHEIQDLKAEVASLKAASA